MRSGALAEGGDPKTLRKHYRDELDTGHVKANAKVAENLYRKATGEGREAVVAAIFWLKTRAGWKETSVHEVGGSGGGPLRIERIERVIIDPRDTLAEADRIGSDTGQNYRLETSDGR